MKTEALIGIGAGVLCFLAFRVSISFPLLLQSCMVLIFQVPE